MNDSTVGAMMFVLGVVLAILAVAVPGLFYWLFWIVVIILIVYGLYQWLIRKWMICLECKFILTYFLIKKKNISESYFKIDINAI